MTPGERETLETLAGTRGTKSLDKSAIRRAHISGILTIPERLQSAQITAAPTADDFNALQKDLGSIHAALRAISTALREPT